jgi:hypothetical protein
MDAKLFRLPTKPNFYANAGTANPFDIESQGVRSQLPAPDSRYPGYAGPMEDARLVTDYRNHCSRNVPAGKQFATKEWMTKNALDLIHLSRKRQADQSGAIYGSDKSTVAPPVSFVQCSKFECKKIETDIPCGVGTNRIPQEVPILFGTWEPVATTSSAPPPNVATTSVYEGGRNTPRSIASGNLW